MRIYQSSLSYKSFELIREYAPDVKVNVLRSFGLNDNETIRIINDFSDNINSIILDSGVWSKYNNPEKITHTVYDYAKFLKEYGKLFEFYFSYDEDFDEIERSDFCSKNGENQRILENEGIFPYPVPVIHLLEDDIINYYCETKDRYPIVAIGSNAINKYNFRPTVKKIYNAGVNIHAFKIGSSKELRGLHAWSSDCSSHAQWTKAGRCVFYDNVKGKDVDICFRPFDKKGNKQKNYYLKHPLYKDFVWFIDEVVGIDLDDIIKDSSYRTFSNSIYFWWLENFISSENASIVPRFEESDDNGTTEYLNTIFKRT
ncbi:hypothetical protein [Solidesulfovibrio alcoholivorans]|uniref:hypothetical protein n=1 Tax=Solidesulfovibrio alcoholivorans TaxID=81406 RepID=UPI0012EC4593|nr:hypothetical protein [Solidesulfovibrio alcoholivorans]